MFANREGHGAGHVGPRKLPESRLAVLREKVAVGAARGVRKMLFAIGVTAQARLAGGGGRIAVARMAALAGLVFRLRMKAG